MAKAVHGEVQARGLVGAGLEVGLLALLRRHPLIWYFALADGFSWLTLFLLAGWLALPAQLVVLVFSIGPAAAAVTMTAVCGGRRGVRDLLGRVLLWRLGARWYVVALLGIPLVVLAATLLLPDAMASFSPMPPLRWLVTYAVVFVLAGLVGGALFEEVGWRGFALPRLEARLGPLGGTLLLGGLWTVWHLPQYLVLPEWVEQNGGADAASIGAFVLLVAALAPLMTWLFNHTRGSVLIATLAHASVNTALVTVPAQLFPSVGSTLAPFALAFTIVALVLTVVTRGRLGLPLAARAVTGSPERRASVVHGRSVTGAAEVPGPCTPELPLCPPVARRKRPTATWCGAPRAIPRSPHGRLPPARCDGDATADA
jgi:membrane protease YdiL (CAAX protease family)